MGAKGSHGQVVTDNAPQSINDKNKQITNDKNKQLSDKQINQKNVQYKTSAKEFGMYSQPNAKTSLLPVVSALNLKQFAKEMLTAHNDYRKSHGAPRMSLDESLCTYAQNWADHLAEVDNLEHRTNSKYGENIYFCEGFVPTGFRTAQRWYEECRNYDYDNPKFSNETGHFTQLVWCQSRKLGTGVGRSKTGHFFVVANYDPAGNVRSFFHKNVFPQGAFMPRELDKKPLMEKINVKMRPFNDFQKDCLEAHNSYRERHKVQPLKLAMPICKDAQAWAEVMASENKMRSKGTTRYGENIYSVYAERVNGEMPVEVWYSERNKYNGSYSPESGHFSQMVWDGTAELGVGVARSTAGQVFVVAYYFPPGNIQGEHPKNVLNWK